MTMTEFGVFAFLMNFSAATLNVVAFAITGSPLNLFCIFLSGVIAFWCLTW